MGVYEMEKYVQNTRMLSKNASEETRFSFYAFLIGGLMPNGRGHLAVSEEHSHEYATSLYTFPSLLGWLVKLEAALRAPDVWLGRVPSGRGQNWCR